MACTTLLATGNIQKTNLVKLRKKKYIQNIQVYFKNTLLIFSSQVALKLSLIKKNKKQNTPKEPQKDHLSLGLLDKNNYTNFKCQWENILWQMLAKFLNIASQELLLVKS